MSKWPMRGHFRYLRFKTFPMTARTPQCEVFWALLSNPKHSGVPEDSKSPTLEVLGFTPTLGQIGVATDVHGNLIKINIDVANELNYIWYIKFWQSWQLKWFISLIYFFNLVASNEYSIYNYKSSWWMLLMILINFGGHHNMLFSYLNFHTYVA